MEKRQKKCRDDPAAHGSELLGEYLSGHAGGREGKSGGSLPERGAGAFPGPEEKRQRLPPDGKYPGTCIFQVMTLSRTVARELIVILDL